MKRLVTKWFAKWMQKVNLDRKDLLDGIKDVESGIACVDLGASLFKIRIQRNNSGKRSGYRTLLMFKAHDRAIFVYGFAKNERDNIDQTELRMFKKLAHDLLTLSTIELEHAIRQGVLIDLEELR